MCRTIVSVIGIVAMTVTLTHAEMKIGVVNSDLILSEYNGFKEAEQKFQKEAAVWEQEATKKQQEIKDLKDQLDKQEIILSKERKKALEDSINQKIVVYQKYLQDKFGQRGEVATKNEELTKPIIDTLMKVIKRIAKEDNYDLIIDSKAVLHFREQYNINPRILEILNKGK